MFDWTVRYKLPVKVLFICTSFEEKVPRRFGFVSRGVKRSSPGIAGLSLVAEENLGHIERCRFVLDGSSQDRLMYILYWKKRSL